MMPGAGTPVHLPLPFSLPSRRRVETQVLHYDGQANSLQTVKDYGDFELYVDWKITKGGDSGIYLRGNPQVQFSLTFVRVEPYVIPKKSLTGDNTERVDTRVLQVIYCVDRAPASATSPELYVGMQVDVFLNTASEPSATPSALASR